jgi:hypothetical protein
MEALDIKRARLRHELQDAYDIWMRISEVCAGCGSVAAPRDVSGCGEAAQPEWFEYLAAKRRLVLAYAERGGAGDDR